MKKAKSALPPDIPNNPNPAPNSTPRRKPFVERELEFALTPEEKAKLSKELVEALEALEDAEERKGELAAQLAGEIKAHKASYKTLVRALRRGHVLRSVRCSVKFNTPREGYKSVIHPETEKVLESLPMSEFERQENLFPEMEQPEKPNAEKVTVVIDRKPDPAKDKQPEAAATTGKAVM
jgi:hypothetical protein